MSLSVLKLPLTPGFQPGDDDAPFSCSLDGLQPGEEMIVHVTDGNIFDDLGFEPEEAESLKLKAELMSALREWIRREGLSEEEASHRFDVPIAWIQNIQSGRIDQFSVENLLTMLSNIGLSVSVSIVPKKAA